MSKSSSASDSLNSEVLKYRDEPPRKTRGLALRPTNGSYETRLKKSQGHIANQAELESWTNADIAHIGFRNPEELKVLDEAEEEDTKRNLSHIWKSLMGTETENSNEDVARNERTISNYVHNPVAIPDSSIYTRCDDLLEEIFGPRSRNRGMKHKTGLVKAKQVLETSSASSNSDLPIVTHSEVDEGQEDEETREDVNSLQAPLPHLEDWSTTLRSLIKGKKRFQYRDLMDIKNTLREIYNNRANISVTSSLAQEVYKVSQLEIHDVPNQDELRLREWARKSTRYWGIGRLSY